MSDKFPAITRLRKGYVAACEIPATQDGRRAWIGVYPLHPYDFYKTEGDYQVRVFEVENKYLINDNDVWDGVMKIRGDFCVIGEDSLLEKIEEYTSPAALGDPQDCEYPI
jgi:hypothetical protein